jgi:arsenate reductase
MTLFRLGFISSGFLNLSASEAYKEATENNAIILDVRELRLTGYKNFDVPKVIHIPNSTLSENYYNLPADIPLIIADSVGLRSHEAMVFLQNKGFTNIANLAGGIVDWERDGLPIRKEITEQLDGSCVCQLKPRHRHKKTIHNHMAKIKVLILCTGNSCRSQMAQGFLQSFNGSIEVFSAGTDPAARINEKAIAVMKEAGIDISNQKPESVEIYLGEAWDYVITVCDDANETCPVFAGKVTHRLHMGFEDPSKVIGTDEFIWSEFRRIRDEIKNKFHEFYIEQIKPRL